MRDEQRRAFVDFAGAELPGLRRFAYGLAGEWHRADDLVQSALERMYVAWPRLSISNAGAYARTVVVRCAVNETRRSWWKRERLTDDLPPTTNDDHALALADRLDLASALAGLTVKQRAVVVLRYVEDRSIDEVAEILGIAPGTVKRQSHDAVDQLRRRLSPETEGQ
jgi:RNA polymerase sigma-70 factor (sigma-E family)